MSWCPTFTFQVSIMSKWLAKHISTKVSFKITIRKKHVYINELWHWIWNQYFYLWILIDVRNKMIVLPSFQIATRLNSQNTNETEFINAHCTLLSICILVIPIWIIEVSTKQNEVFDFTSVPYTITDLQPMYLFSTYLLWRNGTIWKNVLSSYSKCEKRKSADT